MPRRHLVAVALLTTALTLSATGPASADPRPGPPGPQRLTTSSDVDCVARATPVPQYSSSGGTWGTVHYGAQIVCNVVGSLFFELKLYSVQGTGENEHVVLEMTRTRAEVSSFTGSSWFEPCFGNNSSRWVTSRRPTYDGIAFNPPVQWTAVITLPCGP